MPTLDFTYSNAAPGAPALPSYAGTGGAPGAVAVPSFAGTGAAPGAVPGVPAAPVNALPGAVATASFAGTAAQPGAVPLAAMAPSNAAPSAIALPGYAATAAAPGAIALSNMTGTADVPQQVGYAPIVPSPTDETMHTATLTIIGNLALNQLSGAYQAPAPCVIKGVQLSLQKAPAGADVIITLVNADGVSLDRTATLPAGDSYAFVTFATPLPQLNGAIVRVKVTQIGAGANPGAYLTANLVVQLT